MGMLRVLSVCEEASRVTCVHVNRAGRGGRDGQLKPLFYFPPPPPTLPDVPVTSMDMTATATVDLVDNITLPPPGGVMPTGALAAATGALGLPPAKEMGLLDKGRALITAFKPVYWQVGPPGGDTRPPRCIPIGLCKP